MKFTTKILIISLLVSFFITEIRAQQRVKIRNSETLEGGRKNGEPYDKFTGNVIFSQKDTWVYCDTAIVFKRRNFVEAYGNVKITDGDSVVITSKRLIYDGNMRTAKLRENVVFRKIGIMTLYTDFLDYNRNKQEAYYFNGGKLVDSTNVLKSRKGYYDVNTDMASFKGNVRGENEDHKLISDTLQYHTITKVIFFHSPTTLIDNEGNEYNYEEGQYNTNTKKSLLERNFVETKDYILKGNVFKLDDIKKYYKARTNVELVDKENDIIVTGETGEHWKKQGITKIYDNALLKVIDEKEQDTLFLRADTLVAIDSDIESNKRLLAYPNVRFFKSDLQGICDSIAYHISDSLIFFYGKPVLWSEENQISADSIDAVIVDNEIRKMNLSLNSFVILQDTLLNFNQVKGRKMVAYFEDNKIKKMDVFGNGESIFFALNEEETDMIGMNKTLSSTMIIFFKNNKAEIVKFNQKVDASFIPPHELKSSQRTLKGFEWKESSRPSKEAVVNGAIDKKSPNDQPSKGKNVDSRIPSNKE